MRRPGYLSDYDGLGSYFPESLDRLDNSIYAYQAHLAAANVHDPRKREDARALAELLAKREKWFKRNS
jgi:hypothetical protein